MLVGGAACACAALYACASGQDQSGAPDAGSDGGYEIDAPSDGTTMRGIDAGDGGPATPRGAPVGSPCPDGGCASGSCTFLGGTRYCTTPCPPACPDGTYCSIVGGNSICVPDLGQECEKCTAPTDCKLPSDNCLTAPLGDSFCARDCTVDGVCPTGFVCTSGAGYGPPEGGAEGGAAAEGGTDDGGAEDGGAEEEGGAGGGGEEGGMDDGGPLPSAPDRWCVPAQGASCACDATRNGVTNKCSIANDAGTCTGVETCNGDGDAGTWGGCTAMTPTPEICNGKDDNCSGMIDQGNPNTLCAFMGPPPPNANWACINAMCVLGTCDPGWTNFPPGNAATGCACPVDSNFPNGTCATATNVGSISDVAGSPLVLQGTLSSATDVEVFAFDTVDEVTATSTANAYHVSIAFTAPTPNGEFVMDVLRGSPCTDAPTGANTGITSYDWCVNGTAAGPVGEDPCGPATTGAPHCTDHSSQYYVRVYRPAGVTQTCTQFQISVTASGGACDFTQSCP